MRVFIASLLSFCAINVSGQLAKTSGNRIVINNESIDLKGINLGNWLIPEGYMFKLKKTNSPSRIFTGTNELIGPYSSKNLWKEHMKTFITKKDILYINELGFNHVRLPFHYKMFNNEDYLGVNYHGFELIDSTIQWCKEVGLHLILDMHCAPCGQTGDNIDDSDGYPFLYTSIECQDELVQIWKVVSNRYKDEKQILGYGLLNEPIAHYFVEKDSLLNTGALALYKRVVQEIRNQNDNHIVFLGGVQWNTNFDIFENPFEVNLVYEFHKYWMPVIKSEIQAYLNYSNEYDVPIYLGESGENTMDWIKEFRQLLEGNNIGWCFWTYKKMNSDRCVVQYKEPELFSSVIQKYLESDRSDYKRIRESHPGINIAKNVLYEVVRNSNFDRCNPNVKYIEALFDNYIPINAAP